MKLCNRTSMPDVDSTSAVTKWKKLFRVGLIPFGEFPLRRKKRGRENIEIELIR